jgi:hypothetical protein
VRSDASAVAGFAHSDAKWFSDNSTERVHSTVASSSNRHGPGRADESVRWRRAAQGGAERQDEQHLKVAAGGLCVSEVEKWDVVKVRLRYPNHFRALDFLDDEFSQELHAGIEEVAGVSGCGPVLLTDRDVNVGCELVRVWIPGERAAPEDL